MFSINERLTSLENEFSIFSNKGIKNEENFAKLISEFDVLKSEIDNNNNLSNRINALQGSILLKISEYVFNEFGEISQFTSKPIQPIEVKDAKNIKELFENTILTFKKLSQEILNENVSVRLSRLIENFSKQTECDQLSIIFDLIEFDARDEAWKKQTAKSLFKKVSKETFEKVKRAIYDYHVYFNFQGINHKDHDFGGTVLNENPVADFVKKALHYLIIDMQLNELLKAYDLENSSGEKDTILTNICTLDRSSLLTVLLSEKIQNKEKPLIQRVFAFRSLLLTSSHKNELLKAYEHLCDLEESFRIHFRHRIWELFDKPFRDAKELFEENPFNEKILNALNDFLSGWRRPTVER